MKSYWNLFFFFFWEFIISIDETVRVRMTQWVPEGLIEKLSKWLAWKALFADSFCRHKFTYEDECKAVKSYIDTVFNEVPKVIKQFGDILESHGYRNIQIGSSEEQEIDFSQHQLNFADEQFKLCENIVTTITHWKLRSINCDFSFSLLF